MVIVDRDLDPHPVAELETAKADADVVLLLQILVEAILSRSLQPYNASAMSFFRWL